MKRRTILTTALRVLVNAVAVAVLFGVAVAAFGGQTGTVEEHLVVARKAIEAGDWKTAEKELARAKSLRKDAPEVYYLLAAVKTARNDVSGAIKEVRRALEYRSQYPEARVLYAQLLLKAGNFEAARKEAELAVTQDPSSARAHARLGNIFLVQKAYADALASYDKALQLGSPGEDGYAESKDIVDALRAYVDFDAHKGDPGYVRPKVQNNPWPRYTKAALEAGVSGKIHLLVHVDEVGKVRRVLLLNRLGHGLDEEAVNTANLFQFAPATRNGVPTPLWVPLFVNFSIRS
jgi:TonB family protein